MTRPAVSHTWVMLGYRIPREPSTPRITVWRQLRRLGAAQPVDGLAMLPETARATEALQWVAQRVQEAGGQATLWTATHRSLDDERDRVEAMNQAVTAEYATVTAAATAALDTAEAAPGNAVAAHVKASDASAVLRRRHIQLSRSLTKVQARDYFGAPGRQQAQQALTALALAARQSNAATAR